jgi:hypothetical protein
MQAACLVCLILILIILMTADGNIGKNLFIIGCVSYVIKWKEICVVANWQYSAKTKWLILKLLSHEI